MQCRLATGALGAGVLLALSACSMGGHDEDGHHGGGHDDQAAQGGHDEAGGEHHAEGEDHHQGMAGQPGDPTQVDRRVAVSMTDAMSYTPASMTVERGETIRFDVTNDGQLVHEFVLGSDEEILEHHELMKRFPGMEHDEPNSVSLAAGGSGEVVWQFSEAGQVTFACLQPGHYEAGMKGAVLVSASP